MGIDLVPHAILRMQNLKVWSFVDPEKMLVEKSKMVLLVTTQPPVYKVSSI